MAHLFFGAADMTRQQQAIDEAVHEIIENIDNRDMVLDELAARDSGQITEIVNRVTSQLQTLQKPAEIEEFQRIVQEFNATIARCLNTTDLMNESVAKHPGTDIIRIHWAPVNANSKPMCYSRQQLRNQIDSQIDPTRRVRFLDDDGNPEGDAFFITPTYILPDPPQVPGPDETVVRVDMYWLLLSSLGPVRDAFDVTPGIFTTEIVYDNATIFNEITNRRNTQVHKLVSPPGGLVQLKMGTPRTPQSPGGSGGGRKRKSRLPSMQKAGRNNVNRRVTFA